MARKPIRFFRGKIDDGTACAAEVEGRRRGKTNSRAGSSLAGFEAMARTNATVRSSRLLVPSATLSMSTAHALTKKRIVGYWNCYFRSLPPRLVDYVGFRISGELELWSPKERETFINR